LNENIEQRKKHVQMAMLRYSFRSENASHSFRSLRVNAAAFHDSRSEQVLIVPITHFFAASRDFQFGCRPVGQRHSLLEIVQ